MDEYFRYRGAMIGLAAGDALGCPVEGLKAGHITQLYGRVDSFVDPFIAWKKKPHRWRLPGLYSDDTQQALALSDTLVKCNGFDASYFARLLTDMARADTGGQFGAHRGTGKNFRGSVRALMEGADPFNAGMPSAGIGAMMRSAPCGLYFGGDVESTMRAAVEQGLVTHRDPRSLVMAALCAVAVSGNATGSGDGRSAGERLSELSEAAGRAEDLVEKEYIHLIPVACMDRFGMAKSALDLLPRLVELPERSMALKQIVAESNRQFPEHKITEPGQGFVMAAGVTALYIALTARDLEEGVIEAVSLGKDTDSMAAIVGAIMGARWGEESVPDRWRDGLVNFDQVALRGEALLYKSSEGLGLTNLARMEAELTSREVREREALIERLAQKGEYVPASKPRSKAQKESGKDRAPTPRERKDKKHKPKRVKAPWKRSDWDG
ncbi:MAG: ADP-ribosylglycohydrolase family protein [bacterium]